MRRLLAPLHAIAFLTRIPVGIHARDDAELRRAAAFFPLVGLLIGGLLAGTAWLGEGHLASAVLAILLVALSALVTGGLHLDGFADVWDGLMGGKGDRQRTLAIMRDSRSGPGGIAALVLLLLAKVSGSAAALGSDDLPLLALAPAVARLLPVVLMAFLPYARQDGMGGPFRGVHAWTVAVAFAVTCLSCLLLGPSLWPPLSLALALALAFSLWLSRRLHGLTGDCYGAAVELCETLALLAAHPRG